MGLALFIIVRKHIILKQGDKGIVDVAIFEEMEMKNEYCSSWKWGIYCRIFDAAI